MNVLKWVLKSQWVVTTFGGLLLVKWVTVDLVSKKTISFFGTNTHLKKSLTDWWEEDRN